MMSTSSDLARVYAGFRRFEPLFAYLSKRLLIYAYKRGHVTKYVTNFGRVLQECHFSHAGAILAHGPDAVYHAHSPRFSGYQHGGLPDAIAGGIGGVLLPEIITSPSAEMGAARVLRSPKTWQVGRGVVAQLGR